MFTFILDISGGRTAPVTLLASQIFIGADFAEWMCIYKASAGIIVPLAFLTTMIIAAICLHIKPERRW